MIAVDTNILIRVLIDDPGQPDQTLAARTLVSKAGQIIVAPVVLVECVWVLESAYRLKKDTIIELLSHLFTNGACVLQDEAACRQALAHYRNTGADFADGMILAQAEQAGLELYTFDKRLAKSTHVHLVETQPSAVD